MERKPHKEVIVEVDITLPINPKDLAKVQTETDCFGHEHDPSTKECTMCASSEICSILKQEQTKGKVAEMQKESGNFVDEVDLDIMDWDKIEKLVEKYEKTGKPLKVMEFFGYIKKQLKTKDEKLVVLCIKKFVKSREKVYTKDKLVRYRL